MRSVRRAAECRTIGHWVTLRTVVGERCTSDRSRNPLVHFLLSCFVKFRREAEGALTRQAALPLISRLDGAHMVPIAV